MHFCYDTSLLTSFSKKFYILDIFLDQFDQISIHKWNGNNNRVLTYRTLKDVKHSWFEAEETNAQIKIIIKYCMILK